MSRGKMAIIGLLTVYIGLAMVQAASLNDRAHKLPIDGRPKGMDLEGVELEKGLDQKAVDPEKLDQQNPTNPEQQQQLQVNGPAPAKEPQAKDQKIVPNEEKDPDHPPMEPQNHDQDEEPVLRDQADQPMDSVDPDRPPKPENPNQDKQPVDPEHEEPTDPENPEHPPMEPQNPDLNEQPVDPDQDYQPTDPENPGRPPKPESPNKEPTEKPMEVPNKAPTEKPEEDPDKAPTEKQTEDPEESTPETKQPTTETAKPTKPPRAQFKDPLHTDFYAFYDEKTNQCFVGKDRTDAMEKMKDPGNAVNGEIIVHANTIAYPTCMANLDAMTERKTCGIENYDMLAYCAKVQFYGKVGVEGARKHMKRTDPKTLDDYAKSFMQADAFVMVDGCLTCDRKAAKATIKLVQMNPAGPISKLCPEEETIRNQGVELDFVDDGKSSFFSGGILQERLCPSRKSLEDRIELALRYVVYAKLVVEHDCVEADVDDESEEDSEEEKPLSKHTIFFKTPIEIKNLQDNFLQLRELSIDLNNKTGDTNQTIEWKWAKSQKGLGYFYYVASETKIPAWEEPEAIKNQKIVLEEMEHLGDNPLGDMLGDLSKMDVGDVQGKN